MQIRRRSAGKTHLDPGDKLGHVPTHELGEGSRRGVVLAGPAQPVDHDHVGAGLTLVEGGHQLGHPALVHARYLRTHARLFRVSDVAGVSCSVTFIVLVTAPIPFLGEQPGGY